MFNLLLHACAFGAAPLALPQDPYTELFGATLHFGDFDRDGADDIYVTDPVAGDRLLHNAGGGLYEDVTGAHGLESGAQSLFALWFDFDADGALDLCVGGIDGSLRLLQNADRGHFVDVTPTTGLQVDAVGLDAEARDLDGDGRADLHISSEVGGVLFRNAGAGRFERLSLPDPELAVLMGENVTGDADPEGRSDLGADSGRGNAKSDADRSASRAAAARARRSALVASLGSSAATGSASAGGASIVPSGGTTTSLLAACMVSIDDNATANCFRASSVPTLGMLYPISNEFFVATNGRVGLGTTAPENRLHVLNGSAGSVTAGTASIGVFENNANASLHVLTPDVNERAVVFSGPATAGALVHNSALVPNGFELRTGSTTGTRMVVTSAGNVGIGHNAPSENLTVGNGVRVDANEFNSGTTANSLRFGGSNSGEAIASRRWAGDNQYGLDFYTGATPRMAISLAGNVGIGTVTPGNPLVVAGSVQTIARFTSSHIGGTWVDFTNTSAGAHEWSIISAGSSNGEGPGALVIRDNTVGVARMVVRANGDVGIGTGSPAFKLHVAGDAYVSNTTGCDGNVYVDFNNTNSGNLTGGSLFFGAQGTGEAIACRKVGGANTNQLDFYTAFTSRLTIDNSGRVGIGRQPSSFALEVQGDACKTGGSGFWNICSDRRIKTDVRTIDSALATLDRLRLVQYRYTDEYLAKSPSTDDKVYFNVIAQEYAEVFPEYVSTSDADGILKVDTYPALIHALAAVQELHDIVRAQDAVLAEAAETAAAKDAEIARLEERLARLEATFERFAATQVSGDGR